ncbi:hypothetical protein BGX23_010999, partial [Mortierella sp. AD031]
MSRLEQASKRLFRTSVKTEDRSIFNALATVQLRAGSAFVPQDISGTTNPASPPATPKFFTASPESSFSVPNSASSRSKTLPKTPAVMQQPWLSIFPQNVTAPTFSTALPPPGTRFDSTAQLAYCNNLLRKYLSPASAAETVMDSLDASQIAVIKPYAQDEEEATR